MIAGASLPSLTVIKPGKKNALIEGYSTAFENCISSSFTANPALSFNSVDLDPIKLGRCNNAGCGVYYADNVLSSEECSIFRKCIDSCKDLTFWSQSTDESSNPSDLNALKMFRDADTVEIESNYIANCIWRRIKDTFLNSPTGDARIEENITFADRVDSTAQDLKNRQNRTEDKMAH